MPDPTKIKITGGRALSGEVTINGAKNSATKLMIASLLTEDKVTINNLPLITDVDITKDICEQIGSIAEIAGHSLTIQTAKVRNPQVRKQTRKNRLSVLAMSPLLHRTGHAELPVVGGDDIGARPVNFHIEALKKMGASINETSAGYSARADGLRGTDITLPYPSVGATENIILAATLAKGRTVIRNAAIEPELTELVMMLQQMGAIIEFRANRVVIIDGVKKLHGVSYSVMPDRLEAATFAVIAIATGGEILVKEARQADLLTFLNSVRRIGADYQVKPEGILFGRPHKKLKPVEITTDVWPGFATDWQQPFAVLLTQAEGESIIHETVYDSRFGYTKTLNRMGANITTFDARISDKHKTFRGPFYNQSARIVGPTPLKATSLNIPDIRAGMAHVVAALSAKGTSVISGTEHLFRGYEAPLEKLKAVGAELSTA